MPLLYNAMRSEPQGEFFIVKPVQTRIAAQAGFPALNASQTPGTATTAASLTALHALFMIELRGGAVW
ncbi:MAG: hypothetical protein WCD47_10375 [Candidatus Sulfotelmatobacter sp.]